METLRHLMGAHLPLAHDHPAWEDFGFVEWTIAGAAALFTAWAIWRAVVYTLRPGEADPDHIKRMIFEPSDEATAGSAKIDIEPKSRGESAHHA